MSRTGPRRGVLGPGPGLGLGLDARRGSGNLETLNEIVIHIRLAAGQQRPSAERSTGTTMGPAAKLGAEPATTPRRRPFAKPSPSLNRRLLAVLIKLDTC